MTLASASSKLEGPRSIVHRPSLYGLSAACTAGLLLCLMLLCAAVAEAKVVRVGYEPGHGTIDLAPSGMPSGYGVEYFEILTRHTDWEIQYEQCAWPVCLERLEAGTLDMVPAMQRTPERAARFLFPAESQGAEYGRLYALENNSRLFYDDAGSFNNIRVGFIRSNAINIMFEGYRKIKDFTVQAVYFEDTASMSEALHSGVIDALVAGSVLDLKKVKVVAQFGALPYYVGISRKRPDLQREMNAAAHIVLDQDMYFQLRLEQKYSAGKRSNIMGLTRSEALFVQTAPPIRVAINPQWWPVEHFDGSNPVPEGIMCDILQFLARGVGLTLDFVRTGSYGESLELMRRGEVDIITGVVSHLNDELSGIVNVSTPILRLPLVLAGKSEMRGNLGNAPVGIRRDMFPQHRIRDGMGINNVVYYDSFTELSDSLRRGQVPLMLMTSWRYGLLVREPGFHDLRVINLISAVEEVGLGISSRVSPQLYAVLNKAVLRVDQNLINSVIFTHTMGREPLPQWEVLWRAYGAWLLPTGLMLLLCVVVAALYNKMRSSRLLERVARTDELTGIGNIKGLLTDGKRMVSQGKYAYVSMDINNFKNFNGYYGHQAGNVVLQQVSRILDHFCNDDELVCRNAGDEFVMLLRWTGNIESMRQRIEGLCSRLDGMDNPLSLQKLKLAFSFGVYHVRQEDSSLQAAGDRATMARKSAKESYKTTIGVYDEEMHRRITEEQQFEQEMLGAQARGEFFVRLQSKCDLRNGMVVGAEALIRWQHPQKGEIMPDAFVGLFERNGFIARLDMYVLDFVCRTLRRWLDEGRTPVPISVNMSRLHVLDCNFVDSIKTIINAHSINPHLLELELTETAFLENTDLLLQIMEELSQFGVRISMDDFGTGYSSLNMLKSIPVDVLKLDRAFLVSLDSERSRNIIRHVVRMAKDMDMQVVCEGIETAEQMEILRSMQCDLGQGYYFSRPVSLAAFEDMIFAEDDKKSQGTKQHGDTLDSCGPEPRNIHV